MNVPFSCYLETKLSPCTKIKEGEKMEFIAGKNSTDEV